MRALLLLPLILVLTACPGKKEPVPQAVPAMSSPVAGKVGLTPVFNFNAPEAPVTENWRIEDVQVVCGARNCPPQVGVIIFAGENSIRRCTGFVIGENADRVVSTGHCDGSLDNGYFVLGSGRSKQIRRLKSVLFKKEAPSGVGFEARSTAGLMFELNEPVVGMPGLRLASGPQIIFDTLTTYMINSADGRALNFRVDASVWHVRRHESIFPYDLSEVPDLLWLFDGRIQGGNSGGPGFAEGSAEVQTIVQSYTTPERYGSEIRNVLKREPIVFEKHWMALSTNARCLPYPDMKPSRCTHVTDEESQRRFLVTQQEALLNLKERSAPGEFAAEFASNQNLFPLQGSNAEDTYFESVYLPYCRKSDRQLNEILIPSEYVRYGFNEWAQARTEVLDVRATDATVTQVQGTLFEFQGQWSEPYAPLVNDVEHPRRKWGTRFAIDLPLCPR